MALLNAAQVLKVIVLMQALVASRGSLYDKVSTSNQTRSSFNTANTSAVPESASPAMPRSLSNPGCTAAKSMVEALGKCKCVDDVYVDKCQGCMCYDGRKSWCNSACDPTGSGAARESSCCQPLKKENDPCGADVDCEAGLVCTTFTKKCLSKYAFNR
eukprot:CAMPEP_0197649692 /NCGR_PEP_ID=MMETSP1338-20131121/29337_1 /TAXON_ID=43686 ORGANISM="Pelagodinium beii, Strain RCC1491" /NCGR_SAMPLE_ID=MMETSP1338 /ASSEMBLY_ACC=CAM_ASM_000754 /LENGTH=157 /DNA_ID=CAMNT_0043223933 /DNA_START=50 /DNA_END=523 /DNA_ORIENTATION=+